MTVEKRFAEVRADGRTLAGVAVRYGDLASFPWGEERIEVGAFAPVGDVVLNVQHDRAAPLARTGGAGLVLDDSAERLEVRAELPPTRAADDVLELVRRGVMRGLSVEFRVVAERLDGQVRVIERAALSGVAVVDTPAYPQSDVEARRRRGERRIIARGGIKYGVKAFCECLAPPCKSVLFRYVKLDAADDVIATSGRMDQAFASTRAGTLRLDAGDDGVQIGIDRLAMETDAGAAVMAQARAVPVYARPLVDEARSTFTEAGDLRTYDEAVIRAILVKPIAGEARRREGWDPLTFEGQAPAVRRRRRWL